MLNYFEISLLSVISIILILKIIKQVLNIGKRKRERTMNKSKNHSLKMK